jgi:uncharacterized protein involved in cysteine biosynthesis
VIAASWRAALADLRGPGGPRLLVVGIGINIALLAVLQTLLWSTVEAPGLLPAGGGLTWLFLSPFLMVPVSSAFTALFLDPIAARSEARQRLAGGRRLPVWEAFVANFNALALLVAVNLVLIFLAADLGLMTLPALFLANAALLGKEYFTLAALRRMPKAAATRLWLRHPLRATGAGAVLVGLLLVPFANLAAPVLASAAFARLVGRLAPDPVTSG